MKQAIFLVVDNGCDGKDITTIIYASTNELERDDFYDNSKNKNYYTKREMVADLDLVAQETWNKLNALEKLSLERVDCILWTQKPQSKYSV